MIPDCQTVTRTTGPVIRIFSKIQLAIPAQVDGTAGNISGRLRPLI
jgi:hypothetical protein